MNQVYEVIDKNGKIFHHYEITNRILQTRQWAFAKSPEDWCELHDVNKNCFIFKEIPFHMADYSGWAKPIKEKI